MNVVQTASCQRRGMETTIDRADVEAASALPAPGNEELFPVLLDRVVGRLVESRAEPTRALWIAGQVVRGTPWARYRNGRARLASAAATYLTWLAPPESWKAFAAPKVGNRRAIGWRAPSGEVIVDLLGGGSAYVKALVKDLAPLCPEATAIRAIDLLHPRASTAYEPNALAALLPDTCWWFTREDER